MPFYDFKCPKCENMQTGRCSISKRDAYHPPCAECGQLMDRSTKPTPVGFILRGWDFPGKNLRVANSRKKRNAELDVRQKERYGHLKPTLAPNVNGERVDTWKEAKQLAKEKGHNTSTYDSTVKKLVKSTK